MVSSHTSSEKCNSQFACLDLTGLPLYLGTILLCLVLTILLLEELHHRLHHIASKKPFWAAFLKAMDGELVILGTLSFLLFSVQSSFSTSATEGEENILELIEFAHMFLFVAMVGYYSIIALMARVAEGSWQNMLQRSNSKLSSLSRSSSQPPYCCARDVLSAVKRSRGKSACISCIHRLTGGNWLTGQLWKEVLVPGALGGGEKMVVFDALVVLLGDAFLRSRNLPPDLPFEFHQYVELCMTHLFIKMVKVGWRVWLTVVTSLVLFCITTGFFHSLITGGNQAEDMDHIFADDPDVNAPLFVAFMIIVWYSFAHTIASFSSLDSKTLPALLRIVYDESLASAPAEPSEAAAADDTHLSTSLLSEPGSAPKKSWVGSFFPCCTATGEYRKAWRRSAPDYAFRLFQISLLGWTFFLSLYTLVLSHVSFSLYSSFFYLLFIAPFILINRIGGQGFPKYCCLRFFGPLAREELLEPLVEDARRRYEQGERRADMRDERVVLAIKQMYELVLEIDDGDDDGGGKT
jgi:hypothetical protein